MGHGLEQGYPSFILITATPNTTIRRDERQVNAKSPVKIPLFRTTISTNWTRAAITNKGQCIEIGIPKGTR